MTDKSSGLALKEAEVTTNHVQREEEVVVALKTEAEVDLVTIINPEEALKAPTVALLTTLVSNSNSSSFIIVVIQRRLAVIKPKGW